MAQTMVVRKRKEKKKKNPSTFKTSPHSLTHRAQPTEFKEPPQQFPSTHLAATAIQYPTHTRMKICLTACATVNPNNPPHL
jgi:hypothetical protein